MQGENKNYGKEKGNIMVAKSFEEFFKVRKHKKINKKERLNPHNGLCLNSLHDKAFDMGLLTITKDYRIRLSSKIKEQAKEIPIKELFYK